MRPAPGTYAAAGVDITAAEENVRRIEQHVRSTYGPSVLGDFGAFAGLFQLSGVREPVLVASTDGVGTKLLLAMQVGRFEDVGRDLVNLCVNDVLTAGARPLFFLDYLALHALDHDMVESLVKGVVAACRENGCALLGGETAQLPDLYAPGQFDMAGTLVGVVERSAIVDGASVSAGDRVWALASTGLHTNGFSLARQIVRGIDLDTDPGSRLGQSLADALLAPHLSYYPALAPLLPDVRAIAHITGGGIHGNVPRVLPDEVSVELEWGSWRVPPIFGVLQDLGGVAPEEMLKVFNMGLGLIFITRPSIDARQRCPQAVEIGRVVPRGLERVLINNR